METKLKRSKKFCVGLLDFSLCFIVTLFLFFAGESINVSSSGNQARTEEINQIQNQLSSLVVESRLSYLKEDGYLAQVEDVTKDYIVRQTYTQLDEDKRSQDYFKGREAIDPSSDCLFFYYQNYVPSHLTEYSDPDKVLSVEQYKEELFKLCKNDENHFYQEGDYPFFSRECADLVYSYLVEKDLNLKGDYDLIYNSYSSLLQNGISQYMESFKPYGELVNRYEAMIDAFYQIKIAILLACYFLSITIFYFVLPCVFKDGRTLFMKLFNVKAVTVDNERISWPHNLIKALCLFLIYLFSTSLVALIVLGGYNGILLIFTYFFGIFNLFALSILSALLTICSMLFTFVKKNKKQTFSEFASLMILIDDDSSKTITIGGQTYSVQNKK